MTNKEIETILKMRMAVYKAGIAVGMWKDINTDGASDMMNYIFPKSGVLAYYNLILEQMRIEHAMLIGGYYTLFKLPAQIEKEVQAYLKKQDNIDLVSLVSESEAYLKEMDTIVTDHSFDCVNIGNLVNNKIDTILRLCASHYRYSFECKYKSYPYFD